MLLAASLPPLADAAADARFRMQVAGASEACVDAISFTGFSRLKALSTRYNDNPTQASRCAPAWVDRASSVSRMRTCHSSV